MPLAPESGCKEVYEYGKVVLGRDTWSVVFFFLVDCFFFYMVCYKRKWLHDLFILLSLFWGISYKPPAGGRGCFKPAQVLEQRF